MGKVPVNMEDKQKSYYKYFLEPMKPIPEEVMAKIEAGPGDNSKVHHVQDRAKLFDPGYMDGEFGYWCLEDGTAVMANYLKMPGVTPEMFDWWGAWHPLDRLRYAIWNPEEHYDVYLEQECLAHATDMSIRPGDRLPGSIHHIWEDIGLGQIDFMRLNFMDPDDFGYDGSLVHTDVCGAIVCGNGITCGNIDEPDAPVMMTHFIRPIEGGSELRTRFWMGWRCIDGKAVKMIPDGVSIPAIAPKMLLIHSVKEMTRLAEMLPRLYPEEKDNW